MSENTFLKDSSGGTRNRTQRTPQHGVGTMVAARYRLVADIGAGGMGQVFKAEDMQAKTVCAVKVMHNHLRESDINLKRFEREGEVAVALKHENIVSVTDYGFTETMEPFIVMEFLEGESLADILQTEKQLSIESFCHIFGAVCSGLSYAHLSNVVHRDVKPSNIMILGGPKGQIKIVDFGIARVCKSTGEVCPTSANASETSPGTVATLQGLDSQRLQQLTQPGEIFGSPLYMSPEQFYGEEADCRSEVYALGCMMFESLAGKPPLKGSNAMATLAKKVTEVAPPIRSLNEKVPPAVESMIERCLERNPDERYQTVAELREALLEATNPFA